jgi:hypothetical protein
MEVIAIIELIDNAVQQPVVFIVEDVRNTSKIVAEAEALFKRLAVENGAKNDNLDTHLDDGYYTDGLGYLVNFSWCKNG